MRDLLEDVVILLAVVLVLAGLVYLGLGWLGSNFDGLRALGHQGGVVNKQ